MITFKPVVRNVRADGYAAIYIRVTKDRETDYIKTAYVARRQQLSGKNIKDYTLVAKVSTIIDKYVTRLNLEETEFWTLREVVSFLMQENSQISFSDFFREYTNRMKNAGRERPATGYITAFNSLKDFAGKEHFFFSEITSKLINAWIDSLKATKRAKEKYPSHISTVFKAGTLQFNDYERGILRIKNQPFLHVDIPRSETPEKRAVEPENLRKIFLFDCKGNEKMQFAKDIALLVFCLAGINAKDLYVMKKHNFSDEKLHYNRSKTMQNRQDKAYIEIAVPELLFPVFNRYKSRGESLFDFSQRFRTSDYLMLNVNKNLLKICTALRIEKVTTYSFRHSWATIARNNCGYSDSDVAFALNHASEHRITRGYIKTDFTLIDKMNKSVIDFVFSSSDKQQR
jgi:integrase